MLAGGLPLPHYENEDVDVSLTRKVVLISADVQLVSQGAGRRRAFRRGHLEHQRPDIEDGRPLSPRGGEGQRRADRDEPERRKVARWTHIANCILDCNYAWVTGARDGSIYVVDLRNLDDAKIIGKFFTRAGKPNAVFKTGTVHDVKVDPYGNVWATGSGGTAMYAPITNPLRPRLLASIAPGDNSRYDQFIHHNSVRLDGQTVLVTQEDWEQPQCGHQMQEPVFKTAGEQGSFQVWKINRSRLTPLGTWRSELGKYLDGGAAVTIVCSSHWFSSNRNKVVAVGWYNQGVRFLDVSNPRAIRQVGYWMGPHTTASAGLFAPSRPDIVYVPDYTRGLDVLKIDNGGYRARTTAAPVRAEWFTNYPGVRFEPVLRRHPVWGWSCARPVNSPDS